MAHRTETAERIGLVVMAVYGTVFSPALFEAFPNLVLNTHPALLPAFPGAHAVRDSLAAGATGTGASIFWVNDGVDTGEGFHVKQIEDKPSAFFTDIHSSEAVPGAVRGQMGPDEC